MKQSRRILFAGMNSWHLNHTARGMLMHDALAGYWTGNKCMDAELRPFYQRIWPYHLIHKPFCHLMFSRPMIDLEERVRWWALPAYDAWIRSQKLPSGTTAVQAPMGSCEALFDLADRAKRPILKIFDAPNTHPSNLKNVWQSECDRFEMGYQIPIPQSVFRRIAEEIARADMVLCPSVAVKESMVQQGVDEAKCFISHFGVNKAVFKPRTALPEKPTFLCVGSICLRKGHQYLFRAWERVKRELPEGSRLICVGGVRPEFASEWKRWAGTFEHIPALPHAELARLLATSTAFVFPSLEEGFARVLSEALACGLPLIATHESGATTVMQDGVQGIVIRPRDIEGLADAILKLGCDPQLNEAMGKAAARVGQTRNTWQDYSNRLYEEIKRRHQCLLS